VVGKAETLRNWIGRNPTWFWRNRQIHSILCDVTIYWSNWHDRKAFTPPPTISPRKKKAVRILRNQKRMERIEQIFSGHRKYDAWSGDSLLNRAYAEKRLYAAVVRRAYLDYAVGVVSPLARNQRMALNAYWWIMGLPLLLTHKAMDHIDTAEKDLIYGRTRRWKVSPKDPYDGIDLIFDDIVQMHRSEEVYYPAIWSTLEPYGRLMTFQRCCDLCNLDVHRARAWLHLVRPDEL